MFYGYVVQVVHRYAEPVGVGFRTKRPPALGCHGNRLNRSVLPGAQVRAGGAAASKHRPRAHRQTDYKHRTDNLTQLGQNGLKFLFQLWTSKTKRNSLAHLDKKNRYAFLKENLSLLLLS